MNREERRKYYSSHPKHREWDGHEPIIREFVCRYYKCGKTVRVVDPSDHRTVFCCPQCEKAYWKHPKEEIGVGRNGNALSGGMSLGGLIKRERRDLC